jgi:hypothetical protein
MEVPSSHREAIELCQDTYEKVRKLQSCLAPENIEEFEEIKKALEYVELFIVNSDY